MELMKRLKRRKKRRGFSQSKRLRCPSRVWKLLEEEPTEEVIPPDPEELEEQVAREVWLFHAHDMRRLISQYTHYIHIIACMHIVAYIHYTCNILCRLYIWYIFSYIFMLWGSIKIDVMGRWFMPCSWAVVVLEPNALLCWSLQAETFASVDTDFSLTPFSLFLSGTFIFSDEKCRTLLSWHQEEVKELSPEEKAELSEKKREMIRTAMLMRANTVVSCSGVHSFHPCLL